MSIREMQHTQKVAWTILVLLLCGIEIRTIQKQDAQNIAERQKQNEAFDAIVARLDSSSKASQQQFEATMQKENAISDSAESLNKQSKSLIAKTISIGSLAERSLQTVTGEGSAPCIVPQSHAAVNELVPLVVWNRGKNDLTGVEVRLLSEHEFLDQLSIFYKPPAELGTLHPTWPKPLPEGVHPIPDSNGVANYLAEIWTQNGYYTETINFRRGKYSLPWAYQYWLTKQERSDRRMSGTIVAECKSSEWSDDLGDGKPVK